MINVEVLHEKKRGCGYRKPGGLYLMASGEGRSCGKLPLVLDICPTCGGGVKPTRGWTWVDADALFREVECSRKEAAAGPNCVCPLNDGIGRTGLLWIGESFYKTTYAFLREAKGRGISRRIPALPTEFKLGETWVLLAHRKAVTIMGKVLKGKATPEPEEHKPAIFQLFRPDRVEYVVEDGDTEKKLEDLVKRGITPVKVVPVPDDEPLANLVKHPEGLEISLEAIRRKIKASEDKVAGYMVDQIPFEFIRSTGKDGLCYQVEREVIVFAETAADLLAFFGK